MRSQIVAIQINIYRVTCQNTFIIPVYTFHINSYSNFLFKK